MEPQSIAARLARALPRPASAAALGAVVVAAAACASSGAPAATALAPSPSTPAGWTLVFSDEFETPGALDPAKWGYEIGYIANDEKQYYTSRSENVQVEGGQLVIEARKEPYQGPAYTSARVNTRGRFEFLYGRVEVRARLPAGRGAWPACGEVDIMENVGFDPLRIHASVRTAAYNHMAGTQKTTDVTIASPALRRAPLPAAEPRDRRHLGQPAR